MDSKSRYIIWGIMIVCSSYPLLRSGAISIVDDNMACSIREKYPAHITYHDEHRQGASVSYNIIEIEKNLEDRRKEVTSATINLGDAMGQYAQAYLPVVRNVWEGMRPRYLRLLHEYKQRFPKDYTDVSPELTVGVDVRVDYGPYWLHSGQAKNPHNDPQRYQRFMHISAPYIVKSNRILFQDLTHDELVGTVAWAGAYDILLLNKRHDTANKLYGRVGFAGKLTGVGVMLHGLLCNQATEVAAGGLGVCASEIYQRFLIYTEHRSDIQRCDKLSLDLGGLAAAQGLITLETKHFFEYHIHHFAHQKTVQLLHGFNKVGASIMKHKMVEKGLALFDSYPSSVRRIATSMEYYFKKHRAEHKDITADQSRAEILKWAQNLVSESFEKIKALDISVDRLTVEDVRAQIDPIQKELIAEIEKVAAKLK